MKRLTTVVCLSLLVMGLVAAGSFNSALAADKQLLSIATASTGGSWYPAGGAISSIVNKYIPNTEASAHPSAASRENIRLLDEKKTDLAMVMPDVAYYAQTATDIYKGKPAAKIIQRADLEYLFSSKAAPVADAAEAVRRRPPRAIGTCRCARTRSYTGSAMVSRPGGRGTA